MLVQILLCGCTEKCAAKLEKMCTQGMAAQTRQSVRILCMLVPSLPVLIFFFATQANERELQMVSQNFLTTDNTKKTLEQKKIGVDVESRQARSLRDRYDGDLKTCTQEITVYTNMINQQTPKVQKVCV
jgi:hypothetical protein